MKNKIVSYLDELIKDPKCSLNYNKDYELLIATMLSAQTTDKRVNEVTSILFKKYPDLNSLANANIDDIKEIIRPLGTYNIKSKNIINIAKELNIYGMSNNRKFLESLSGVGRKTANVVLCNIYNEQCIAVDTHVSRVSNRLGISSYNDDVNTIESKLTKFFKNEDFFKIHHQLLLFGRHYCKKKNPMCSDCKLKDICKKNETN